MGFDDFNVRRCRFPAFRAPESGDAWLLLVVIMAIGASSNSLAATWSVERNGSGDFSVIQDAIDAAAPGDTLLIGPGRYDDFENVSAPGWTEPAVVWINKDHLTLIGAGVGVTRIGPASYYDPPGLAPKVLCCVGGFSCTVRTLTIENCRTGVYWGAGRLELYDSEILECDFGMTSFADGGLLVDGTKFHSSIGTSYLSVAYSPTRNVTMTNCRFTGNGRGAYFTGSENVCLMSCTFNCLRGNIRYTSSTGLVVRCSVAERAREGVIVAENSEVQILDSVINGTTCALVVHSGSVASSSGCVYSGGAELATVFLYSTSQVVIHDCDILNDGGYSVKLQYFNDQFVVQEMSDNYWGTTDTDQIDAWIWDSSDDAGINSTVTYLPIEGGAVPVEARSWSDVKSYWAAPRSR